METVGFIGLGNMGSGMSRNIQKAGYPMVVYDVREEATKPLLERGARLAGSPAEAASLSDVTLVSLPGPKEVEDVAIGPQGILEGIVDGGIYVELSTSRPALIRRIEPMFRRKGAHVLDAPVAGSKNVAAAGELAVYVGGEREMYERIRPILSNIGNNVLYAGGIGCGSICKLVHNMISSGVRMAIAEGMTLGVKAGVEPRTIWDCVRRGDLGRISFLHERMPRRILRGQYEPADFRLATELGREYNVPMTIANLAEQAVIQGLNLGWGDMDSTVTFRLQEQRAGVEVRAPEVDPEQSARYITTHPDA